MPTLHWQKSSYSSEGNNCLELATAPDGTLRLRESDNPTTTLTLRTPDLASLLTAARRGISRTGRKGRDT
ncbi:DUF397 domain-containing protein [Streptomyces aurantiacus]|uniref:DUF397 domain-containing protein n=1 Tax=Streptomyces aurantiacus TaxID=47760 RepID=A0A7G1NYC9_9ACTN|nr:DUF397 domain-containing protein [Streptomyces aurantiacus]BCL28188.1 hypothetical protein GCM10017557_30470 [Streptomyces aurantiacus]